ncbi:MAG: DUF6252 family protein [Candidatus Kapaibacterium sp.]
MNLTHKIYLVAVLFLFIGGCSNSSAPGTNNSGNGDGIPANAGPGEIGFYDNGVFAIRHPHTAGTFGSAIVSGNSGPMVPHGSFVLQVDMQLQKGAWPANTLEMYITMMSPTPGTYAIASSDSIGAWVQIGYDSSGGGAIPGSGLVRIVKFDTVNNLVSGTFHFLVKTTDANSTTDTITGGYFNDISIGMGCYGQGTIRATAEGVSFSSPDTGFRTAWGFEYAGSTVLVLNGDSKDAQGVMRSISIHLDGPKLGTFVLGGQTPTAVFYGLTKDTVGNFGHTTGTNSPGSSGTVTITKFDPVAQRISGTFAFTAPDETGTNIPVTNGVIDNVHYVLY